MKESVIFIRLFKGLTVTFIILAILESALRLGYHFRNSMVDYVPLPYILKGGHGPTPPWRDRLSVLARDDVLLWKYRSNVRRKYLSIFSPAHTADQLHSVFHGFLPSIPDSLATGPVWGVSLNSDGFRDDDFPSEKPPSLFRIICLGDSWTFGQNAVEDQAYPRRLKALLKQEFPAGDFEVLNIAVQGYASYHGVRLLRKFIALHPDVVVIAFAMNDFGMTGARERDRRRVNVVQKLGAFLGDIELYKLLRYWGLRVKWKPKSIGDYVRDMPKEISWKEQEAQRSLNDYVENHREMIDLATSHHARVILLYNELWTDGPYLKALERISRATRVPLVDSSALIAEAQRRIEDELEDKLELRPPAARRGPVSDEIEVVFRVYAGDVSVGRAMYIVGSHPKLGDLVPNKITMYDDGTHGDQRSGDNVWSYSAAFPRGTKLFYVYTNSGKEDKWEGLDVQSIRAFEVVVKNDEARVYTPIESFGRIYMLSDRVHTNSDGYELIAKALLEVLKKDNKMNDYLSIRGLPPSPASSFGSNARER